MSGYPETGGGGGHPGDSELPTTPSMVSAVTNRRQAIDTFLKELDTNRDGDIGVDELLSLMESVAVQRRQRKWMWFAIVALTFCALSTIAATVGLTYAVLKAVQDTEVVGGVMYVKDSTTEIVRTGSAEFTVVDGVFVSRETILSAAATNSTTSGRRSLAEAGSKVPPKAVLRTASYKGTPQRFTSNVSIAVLMELDYLLIKGAGSVELALKVDGVARVPMAGSVLGTVVRIVTSAGTITLDSTVVSFSSSIADIFEEAGFSVSRNRRMLLGIYDVVGFFNWIEIYEPCITPENVTLDRCQFQLPVVEGDDGSLQLPEGNLTEGTRRRRELRTVRVRHSPTTPLMRRSMQGDFTGVVDLAGVEVIDGVRYMTHNETATYWNSMLRTVYEFALMPNYRRIELMTTSDKIAFTWQEENLPYGVGAVITQSWCTEALVPDSVVERSRMRDDTLSSFEFIGYDSKYDRSARHFRLSVKQIGAESFDDLPNVLTVDYWDTLTDSYPLAFEMNHPLLGHMIIQVLNFTTLADGVPETAPELFKAPQTDTCSFNPSIPRLSSPFTVSAYDTTPYTADDEQSDQDFVNGESFDAGDVTASNRRRAILEESAKRAAVWDTLDHINGTGEWPEWALEHYGGVRPAQSLIHGRRIVEELGIKDLEIAKVCAGYDYENNEGFVSATISMWLVIFKVELGATMRSRFWGDWTDWEYCTSITSMDDGGSARGAKILGFHVRIEGRQGWGDDTALNGIE
ncbi:hypothetical protein GPECTOR_189g292 [Gonium pectorale]|uniref:EF-hand domain-containing protein n=1 Tax=Gonium pectorale TaxID=33097 RepID=A0A150FYQ1_GONPE|nr:hypothetical protein GPECTOR_189g292 [Gonium pectorale]|eukprot:KXZ42180.1 hypothetical protein GPECTOR_189g292 [Gonium pectorale]